MAQEKTRLNSGEQLDDIIQLKNIQKVFMYYSIVISKYMCCRNTQDIGKD